MVMGGGGMGIQFQASEGFEMVKILTFAKNGLN